MPEEGIVGTAGVTEMIGCERRGQVVIERQRFVELIGEVQVDLERRIERIADVVRQNVAAGRQAERVLKQRFERLKGRRRIAGQHRKEVAVRASDVEEVGDALVDQWQLGVQY